MQPTPDGRWSATARLAPYNQTQTTNSDKKIDMQMGHSPASVTPHHSLYTRDTSLQCIGTSTQKKKKNESKK